MKMIVDAELSDVAARCLWWAPPAEALADTRQFLCHVMVYGLWDDAAIIRRRFSTDELRDALAHAPAGLFDLRSWHYWHRVLGQPVRQRPSRFPGEAVATTSSKLEFNAQGM
jgi:hypothetical protein